MIKYLDNGILTTYIKELLKTINLPQCHFVESEDDVVYNGLYIIKGKGLYRKKNNDLIFLQPYKFNEEIMNITRTFRNTSLTYDSYTHKYLGDYLRLIRDCTGLDLMSMYNCFSNEYLNNVVLEEEEVDKFDEQTETTVKVKEHNLRLGTPDNSYKIYRVPVKFDRKYTIALDCSAKIEMCCGIYSNTLLSESLSDSNKYTEMTYESKSGCIFSKPFVYDKLDSKNLEKIYNYENYLYLFLKVPFNCDSSIVVLEGDYTDCTNFNFNDKRFGEQNVSKVYSYDTKSSFPHKLQLLAMNTETNYPFADRLIEYIVENAIIPDDKIYQNISRIQSSLGNNESFKKYHYSNFTSGKWDDNLTVALRWLLNDKNLVSTKYDTIGCVDRDLEQEIGDYANSEENKQWRV